MGYNLQLLGYVHKDVSAQLHKTEAFRIGVSFMLLQNLVNLLGCLIQCLRLHLYKPSQARVPFLGICFDLNFEFWQL